MPYPLPLPPPGPGPLPMEDQTAGQVALQVWQHELLEERLTAHHKAPDEARPGRRSFGASSGVFAESILGTRTNMPAPLPRITFNADVMGGKPCIRGMRVTVGTVVGLVATGQSHAEILTAYPYLEEEDIRQALAYAAWRAEEFDVPVTRG